LEVPHGLILRLGLDDEWSWIVLTEANRFAWPGLDLRPAARGDTSSFVCGALPLRFFADVLAHFIKRAETRRAKITSRSE